MLTSIWDFKNWFKPVINNTTTSRLRITELHQVEFTKSGLRTKRFEEERWSLWRGRDSLNGSDVEPLFILNSMPADIPTHIDIPRPSETRIASLGKTFGSKEKVNAVLDQYYNCVGSVTFSKLPECRSSFVYPEREEDDEETLLESVFEQADTQVENSDSDQEEGFFQINSITKRQNIKGVWKWRVVWSDKSTSWVERESFQRSDGLWNDLYLSYEKSHPYKSRTKATVSKKPNSKKD